MAVFILEDLQGSAEVVLFPETLNRFSNLLVNDKIVFVKGKVDCRREKPSVIAEELIDIDGVMDRLAAKVQIRLDAENISKEKIAMIKSICEHHRGKSPVYVSVNTNKGKVRAAVDKNLRVEPDVDFCRKMKQLVGAENFHLAR